MYEEVKHPCVQHKLALIRDESTGNKQFRDLVNEVTLFLCYEALKNVEVKAVTVKTPLAVTECHQIAEDVIVVPILRAGVGMLGGTLDLIPTARVGFVGMYRHEVTKEPVSYYQKLPEQTRGGLCIVIDPMLATGGTGAAAVQLLKEAGAGRIVFVCIVASPEGLAHLEAKHPDVPIYTASVDDHLNEDKRIVPGLGDAGDRLFGTD